MFNNNETEKPECCTDLDEYRDLEAEEAEKKAAATVMSAHNALIGKEAKARDAMENAADAKREAANK